MPFFMYRFALKIVIRNTANQAVIWTYGGLDALHLPGRIYRASI